MQIAGPDRFWAFAMIGVGDRGFQRIGERRPSRCLFPRVVPAIGAYRLVRADVLLVCRIAQDFRRGAGARPTGKCKGVFEAMQSNILQYRGGPFSRLSVEGRVASRTLNVYNGCEQVFFNSEIRVR